MSVGLLLVSISCSKVVDSILCGAFLFSSVLKLKINRDKVPSVSDHI